MLWQQSNKKHQQQQMQHHDSNHSTKNVVKKFINSTIKRLRWKSPIYDQNTRGIPAKEKLYHNLQTTIYGDICLTETWFTAKQRHTFNWNSGKWQMGIPQIPCKCPNSIWYVENCSILFWIFKSGIIWRKTMKIPQNNRKKLLLNVGIGVKSGKKWCVE